MELLEDYFYPYPVKPPQIVGRCRVRIYKRKNGSRVVLLSEAKGNKGEPIAAVSSAIATDLVKRWDINPKTARWIEHTPGTKKKKDAFGELTFTWDSEKVASKAKWKKITLDAAEELTGDVLVEIVEPEVGWVSSAVDPKKPRVR
ncbi:MAG: hypothetical protein AAF702_17780 [Chloroflexota bacterium]